MSCEALSVEEFIKTFAIDQSVTELIALNQQHNIVGIESPASETLPSIDSIDSIDPRNCDINKNEFDLYFPSSEMRSDISLNQEWESTDSLLDPNRLTILEETVVDMNVDDLDLFHVPLSSSVGVTYSNQTQKSSKYIQVVHDLEEEYKARYKSDFFANDGTIRKPRYVADRHKNHFITLKVAPRSQGILRIDWTTIELEDNLRYSMPYKFQTNNDLFDVPDENPCYINFEANESGIVQIYLVLIKLKQDVLKSHQPFAVFPPYPHSATRFNESGSEKTALLTGKQLIEKYQLKKSQITFTHCILGCDGQSTVPDWNTTVYSTVIREAMPDASKKTKVNCPKCKHAFEITLNTSSNDVNHEKPIRNRTECFQKKRQKQIARK